jgi:Protein of unknown function (DUF3489)
MTNTLSDAQLIMLSAAARRHDRCLTALGTLKGAALGKVAAKLISLGLVREAKSKADMPVWRRDGDGNGIALKLTAAGLKAIAVEDEREPEGADAPAIESGRVAVHSAIGSASPRRKDPRAGSKLALALDLLQRSEGATIEQLIGATGWLPHTTRAALTGLRKRGYSVIRQSRTVDGSIYRIAGPEEAASAGVVDQSAHAVKASRMPKTKQAA